MLIDTSHRKWIVACVVVLIVSTAIYMPYVRGALNGPSGKRTTGPHCRLSASKNRSGSVSISGARRANCQGEGPGMGVVLVGMGIASGCVKREA